MTNTILNNFYSSNAEKIAYIIMNFATVEKKSFYFDEFEDISLIGSSVIKLLDDKESSIISSEKNRFNEFFINYKKERFKVLRSCSPSDISWRTFGITKG